MEQGELHLAVECGDETLQVEIDGQSDLAELRGLLFSLTSISPDRQRLSPLPSTCSDDTPVSKLFTDGQRIKLEEGENAVVDVYVDPEDVVGWRSRCTRIFFGNEAVQQPRALSHGRPLCFACATTCRLPTDISGWVPAHAPSTACQCSSDSSRECLFAFGSPMPVSGKLKEAMIVSLNQAKRQIEEQASAQSRQGPHNPARRQQIKSRIQSIASQMLQYEDPALQEQCRAVLPLDHLSRRAREREPEADEAAFRDALFIELLRWFKSDFFSWVDKPSCQFCGAPTQGAGSTQSTPDEARWLASITEIYVCELCGTITRYPRYNHAAKLLETRRGRCGEWAQGFALCCRALGYPTRMILDWTDHLWVEVYSEKLSRWVHADPCESAYDKPLLYEAGWGKKLTYIVAVAKDEVVDVILRYTRQWTEVASRRNEVPEQVFAQIVDEMDQHQRQQVSLRETDRTILTTRRAAEKEELNRYQSEAREVRPDEAVGRTSGSQEWRESRNEMGRCTTTSSSSSQVAPPASYREEFSYQEFSTGSEKLTFLGSAGMLESARVALLTPARNDQVGALWRSDPVSVSGGFFTAFQFQIQRSGRDGADGFAFVIQAVGPGILGQGGCELGYGGIPQSVAVEFDTYESQDRCDDPNGNHISVHTRGQQPNSAHHRWSLGCARHVPQLADGRTHDVVIHYHDTQLDIFFDGALVLTVKVDLALQLGSSSAWLGFTASTGGLNQAHGILSWSFSRP